MKRLVLAAAWVLFVAWGAAKLWGWAWASVSGTPLVEPHQAPGGWLDPRPWFDEEW